MFSISSEMYSGLVQFTPTALTMSSPSSLLAHSDMGVPSLICAPSRQLKLNQQGASSP